jgi:hypothetical protein
MTNIVSYQVQTAVPWTPLRLITVLALIVGTYVIVKVIKSGKKK